MKNVFVNVSLKEEILDPQGRAVLSALSRFGIENVSDVRQGKQFKFTFDHDVTEVELAEIRKVARTLLSNPVIEDFTIEVVK